VKYEFRLELFGNDQYNDSHWTLEQWTIHEDDQGWETFQLERSMSIVDLRRNVKKNDTDEARAKRQEWSNKEQFASYHCSSTRFVLDVIAKGVGSAVDRARGRSKMEHSLKARQQGLDEWDDI